MLKAFILLGLALLALAQSPLDLGTHKLVGGSPILSAFYGSLDITEKVKSLYELGERKFTASNGDWTDPNFGSRKVLIILYQEGKDLKHAIADEWDQFFSREITLPDLAPRSSEINDGPIVYAVYGSKDVTAQAKKLYSDKGDVFEANNAVWGDPNYGLQKWLYIFYLEEGQNIRGKGAFEYGYNTKPEKAESPIRRVVLKHSPILSAYYGTKDITKEIREQYANGVRKFHAENSLWGDPNPGIRKVLVIVYQNGTSAEIKVSDEKNSFTQNFIDLPELPTTLKDLERKYIVAAAYGSKDITEEVINRYISNKFMLASNSYWGDPNFGHEKWLYIFYMSGGEVVGLPAYEYGTGNPPKMIWIP